jgi:hypothetical protein
MRILEELVQEICTRFISFFLLNKGMMTGLDHSLHKNPFPSDLVCSDCNTYIMLKAVKHQLKMILSMVSLIQSSKC